MNLQNTVLITTCELTVVDLAVALWCLRLYGHVYPTFDCRPSLSCPKPLFIASTATDGVSPMPHWKRTRKTWLKQITVDLDSTAGDVLQLATDLPTWRAVTTAARLRVQWWWWTEWLTNWISEIYFEKRSNQTYQSHWEVGWCSEGWNEECRWAVHWRSVQH